MRVLSWDPGIVNLAFCLIDYNSLDDFKILRWKNWDLLKRPKQCNGCMKDGSPCNFAPFYTIKENSYCKKHSSQIKLPNFEKKYITDTSGKKCQCKKPKTGAGCSKVAKFMYNNIHLCTEHKMSHMKKLRNEWIPVNIKVACKKISTTKIQIMLAKKLNSYLQKFNDDQIDIILIENQIAKLAPKMKAISSTIMDYFLIRKECDGYFDSVSEIAFFNPNNKIWVKKGNLVAVPKGEKSYKQNKSNSVKYCRKLLHIKGMDDDLERLDQDKKKDDKTDALLQCLYKMSRLKIKHPNRNKKDDD